METQYGDKVWNWLSEECRDDLSPFQWDTVALKVVELTPVDDPLLHKLFGDEDLADWEHVHDADLPNSSLDAVTF